MKRILVTATLLLTLLGVLPAEARVVVRLGTVAPKGSFWELILRRMGADWGKPRTVSCACASIRAAPSATKAR